MNYLGKKIIFVGCFSAENNPDFDEDLAPSLKRSMDTVKHYELPNALHLVTCACASTLRDHFDSIRHASMMLLTYDAIGFFVGLEDGTFVEVTDYNLIED